MFGVLDTDLEKGRQKPIERENDGTGEGTQQRVTVLTWVDLGFSVGWCLLKALWGTEGNRQKVPEKKIWALAVHRPLRGVGRTGVQIVWLPVPHLPPRHRIAQA